MSTAIAEKSIEDFQFTDEELDKVKTDAYISDCTKYRYWLTRVWDKDLPRVMYVLLNPSTADHTINDPTVRKCMGFAKGWGYGSIEIVNLYAYRATKPANLHQMIKGFNGSKGSDNKKYCCPIGPENDKHIKEASERADLIVVGWGNNASRYRSRREDVLELLKGKEIKCISITAEIQPCHPLMLAFETERIDYIIK